MPRPHTENDFWAMATNSGKRRCWLWSRALNHKGYGHLKFQGRYWIASRLSWTLIFGEIPKGLFVCHKCNVKHCINPGHLYLGTPKQNVDDAIRDGLTDPKWTTQKHCPKGHSNWMTYGKTRRRQCRTCHNERTRIYEQSHPRDRDWSKMGRGRRRGSF